MGGGDGSLSEFLRSNIYGLSDTEINEVVNLIQNLPKHKQLALFSKERTSSKRAVSDYNLQIENDPNSLYRQLFSGAYDLTPTVEQAPLGFDVLKKRKKGQSADDFFSEDYTGNNEKDKKREEANQKREDFINDKKKKFTNKKDDIIGNVLDKMGITYAVEKSVNMMNKGNEFMYDMVYNDDIEKNEDRGGFFTRILNSTKSKFNSFFGYLKEKIYEPVRDFLFGDEGLVNKFKQSELYGNIKTKAKEGFNYIFGTLDASTGFRSGGLMSDSYNSLKDMMKGSASYFTGKDFVNSKGETVAGPGEGSVFGEVKTMFGGFKDTINSYLFGEKGVNADDVKNGVLNVTDMFKDGLQSFTDALFGTKEQRESVGKSPLFADETLKLMKERAPKAIATGVIGAGVGGLLGGKMGLLGSIFLPGGPVSGAIIGTALGFVTQSESFKEWLFGPMDEESKTRVGGFVSANTQEFFKKHRIGMIGGGLMGLVKSAFGGAILPTFLIGGPLTGVATGIASSFIFRSETFKKAMFGEEVDGKRSGGLLGTLLGSFGGDGNAFGKLAVGALGGTGLSLIASQFGLLGGLALSPMGGAVMGAASGVALMSEKWKIALFGEVSVTEDGKTMYRDGGMLGKLMNWTSIEVLQPFKLKMMESANEFGYFLETKIAEPLMHFIDPVKKEIAHLGSTIESGVTAGLDYLMNSGPVRFIKGGVDTVVKGFQDFIFKPFRWGLSKLLNITGKISSLMISLPFRALGALGDHLTNKQVRRGLKKQREEWWDDENLGLFETIGKSISSRFRGTKAYNEGAYGEYGADYYESRANSERERKIKRDTEYNDRKNRLKEMRTTLNHNQKLAKSMGYDVRDADGNLNLEIYRDVEKVMGEKYGTDWTGKSVMQKEMFALEKKADSDRDSIKDNTKSTADTSVQILQELRNPTQVSPSLVSNSPISDASGVTEPKSNIIGLDGKVSSPTGIPMGEKSDIVGLDGKILSGARDKTESEKVRDVKTNAKSEAADANRKSLIAKGSAASQMTKRKAEEAEETTKGFMTGVLSNQTEQLTETKKHSKSWLGIFGSKGVLTVGLLAALAALRKFGGLGSILDWINGKLGDIVNGIPEMVKSAINMFFNEDSPERTDVDGSTIENQNARGAVARIGTRGAVRTVGALPSIIKGTSQVLKKVGTTGLNIAKSSKNYIDDVYRKVFRKGDDITNAAIRGMSESPEAVAKANAAAVAKFKSAADDLMKFIISGIEKLPGGKKLVSVLTPKLKKLFTTCFGPQVQKNLSNTIRKTADFANKGIKIGGKKIPGIDVLFMAYGAATGFSDNEVARLFGVDTEAVDVSMKMATGIVNSLRNFSMLWILDIANIVLVETMGVDFIRELASLLYIGIASANPFDGLSGAEANVKLNTAQSDSREAWKKYNAEQAERNPNFQGISYQAWLDKNNKSLFAQGKEFLTGGVKVLKDDFKKVASAPISNTSRYSGEIWQNTTNKDGKVKTNNYSSLALGTGSSLETDLLNKMNTAVNDWNKLDIKDPEGKYSVVDPVTKKTVKPPDISKYTENSLNQTYKVTDIFTKVNTALSNYEKAYVKNDKGEVIKDPKSGSPIKIKDLNSYINNSMAISASKIASLGTAFGATIEFLINGKKVSSTSSSSKNYSSLNLNSFGGGTFDDPTEETVDKSLKRKPGKYEVYVDRFGNEFGVGGAYESSMASVFTTTSPYGSRWGSMHHGVDLKMYNNAPIPAFTDGEVVSIVNSHTPDSATFNPAGGSYGNMVKVKDAQGHYQIYGHLNAVNVKPGMKIKRGDVLGKQGNTGNSTGSHLHYEVRPKDKPGSSVDPLKYLKNYTGNPSALSDLLSGNESGTESNNTGLMGFIESFQDLFNNDYMNPLSDFSSGMSSMLAQMLGDNSGTLGINSEFPTLSSMTTSTASGEGINQNLTKFNRLTVRELNAWIESKTKPGSSFRGKGDVFLKASAETGLDPRYLVAHAALESGWGTSRIAVDKNNYFGIAAYDSSPYASAKTFGTGFENGIIGGAKWIRDNYTNRGQDTLQTMRYDPRGKNHNYATDPSWHTKIASIMASAPKGNSGAAYSLSEGMGGGTFDEVGSQVLEIFSKNKRSTTPNTFSEKYNTGTPNDTDKTTLMEKIIELLAEIALNTGVGSEKTSELKDQILAMLEELNRKSSSDGQVAVVNNASNKFNSFLDKQKIDKTNRDYQMAKQVSRAF